ncbi:hypothetical protein CEXT_531591 [Caerostris extrusa]|uniref:Uncharacterized protein n=1 Tax=Caerostris extrusa TaxID=172846 RepID=A0AAV4NHG7_CAEEX|nr:hypothetical protein CEXT_531591 [Caerostris extrusa]
MSQIPPLTCSPSLNDVFVQMSSVKIGDLTTALGAFYSIVTISAEMIKSSLEVLHFTKPSNLFDYVIIKTLHLSRSALPHSLPEGMTLRNEPGSCENKRMEISHNLFHYYGRDS